MLTLPQCYNLLLYAHQGAVKVNMRRCGAAHQLPDGLGIGAQGRSNAVHNVPHLHPVLEQNDTLVNYNELYLEHREIISAHSLYLATTDR